MESLLTRDIYLDRTPLAAAGITHGAVNYRGSLSKINAKYCKQDK